LWRVVVVVQQAALVLVVFAADRLIQYPEARLFQLLLALVALAVTQITALTLITQPMAGIHRLGLFPQQAVVEVEFMALYLVVMMVLVAMAVRAVLLEDKANLLEQETKADIPLLRDITVETQMALLEALAAALVQLAVMVMAHITEAMAALALLLRLQVQPFIMAAAVVVERDLQPVKA
jgi:hypothetical protein